MQILKRLLWLFLAGFITVTGGAVALLVSTAAYDGAHEKLVGKSRPNPLNYQPPKPGEVTVSDMKFIEITSVGGIQGTITNHTKRKIESFNANLNFMRKDALLYRCNETVVVDVAPEATSRFQLLCDKVDRRALTADIEPKLSLVWVYPSRDE